MCVARVLQEEFDKREELESIKDELERLLAMEQSKSGELEEHRRRQEALYQYELERLKVLETERRRRDAEYEVINVVDESLFYQSLITYGKRHRHLSFKGSMLRGDP